MDYEKPVEEMDEDECKAEVDRIGKLFDEQQFNLNQFWADKVIILAAQSNALAQLLVEKGIIEQEEADLKYFRLLADRFRVHETVHLPQVRQARIAHQVSVEQQVTDILGPNGNKLN